MSLTDKTRQSFTSTVKPEIRGDATRPISRDGPSTDSYGRFIPAQSLRQCADQIANAMREEIYTDPQGRRVRLLHVPLIPRTEDSVFFGMTCEPRPIDTCTRLSRTAVSRS